jgi:apolipoprotein N-acyltransferase
MKKERTSTTTLSDRWSYLWLAIAILLSLFATGKWVIPLAVWLLPIFQIRFMRTQRALWGYILIVITSAVTIAITWRGAVPPPAYLATVIGAGLIGNLPLLADRLLAPRLKGFTATLVFPLAFTAIEFFSMTTNPMGSFGAQAYTQYGNLALMQLLSVTGMWGLTFLISWLGSVVNWAWERSFAWPEIRRGAALYAGVLALVVVFGSARLAFFPPQAGTVRVASLTVEVRMDELMPLLQDDRDAFRQMTADIHERYFEGTIREARAGAQIVLWPEGAAIGAEEDEAALLARGQEVARQEDIYLAMPLFTIYQDEQRPFENKLVVIDPAGDIVLEHVKYGGNVLEGSLLGDGVLRTVETPYGTLSGVICWDTDFPSTVRQAGRNGTDILLSPAHDWREIDPMHAQMAVFRAIENGVSVVRQADQGRSITADPYGRVLAEMDHFTASERVMVAQAPTNGVFTVYSVIGDLFGWLSVVGFVVIAVWAIVRGRKAARTAPPQPEGQVE